MFVEKGCKAPTFGRSELQRSVRASLSRDAQKSQNKAYGGRSKAVQPLLVARLLAGTSFLTNLSYLLKSRAHI